MGSPGGTVTGELREGDATLSSGEFFDFTGASVPW